MFNNKVGLQNNCPALISFFPARTMLLFLSPMLFLFLAAPPSIEKVQLDGTQLVFTFKPGEGPLSLKEFHPNEIPSPTTGQSISVSFPKTEGSEKTIEFRLSAKDRTLNCFALVDSQGKPHHQAKSVTQWSQAPADPEKGLVPNRGVKGLQVQMIDDALDLGIHHAALNLNLATLIRIPANPGDKAITIKGQSIGLRAEALEGMNVNRFSDNGIRVYLIILAYRSGNPKMDSLLLHPAMLANSPNRLGAFNTETADGVKLYSFLLEWIAEHFLNKDRKTSKVAGWIIGNEINAHHEWYNRGPADPAQVIEDYHRALRIAHSVLKQSGSPGRIYVSLEHHWTARPGPDPKQSLPGRDFLTGLLELCHQQGDFGWDLAYHPYPSNLFEPRTWLDRDARPTMDSPKITFKNLEQLARWMDQPIARFEGKPRRIILSEQGFHSPPGEEGQKQQAAGYVYAWKKIRMIPQIDAFILHRHVDHAVEGGLHLGLWTNQPGQICSPAAKKRSWSVFQAAGTPNEVRIFEEYRSVIGKNAWESVEPKKP